MASNPAPRPTRAAWLALAALLAITLAGFALRVHDLGVKSFWYDELRQVEVAQLPFAEWSDALKLHAARPLDYLITRALLAFTHSEFLLRFPALVWGVLTIPVVYRLGRRLLGRGEGLIGAALFAQSALAVSFAQELRPYSVYALLALVSYWALDVGLRDGSRRAWVVYAVTLALGGLTHYFWLAVVAGQVAYVVLAALLRQLTWRRGLAFAGAVGAGAVALLLTADPAVVLPLAQNYLSAIFAEVGANQQPAVSLHAPGVNPFAPTLTSDFFVGRILEQLGAGGGLALWLFGGLALVGLVASVRARVRHGTLLARFAGSVPFMLAWLLAGPALIVGYLFYRNEIFAVRYILFALPVYLLLAARGALALTDWLRRLRASGRLAGAGALAAALLALSVANVLAVEEYYRTPKDDWRRMGAFLQANVQPGDAIFAPDVQPFVEFYFPGASAYLIYADARREAQYTYAQHARTWFVVSNWATYDIGDTRKIIEFYPGVTFQWAPSAYIKFTERERTEAEMQQEAQGFYIPPPSLPAASEP